MPELLVEVVRLPGGWVTVCSTHGATSVWSDPYLASYDALGHVTVCHPPVVSRAQAAPHDHWTSHRRDAQDEDVRFLLGTGLSLEEACVRVGVQVQTYEQRQVRTHGKDKADA